MKASIIKIGNSKGIRIPKPILEQCNLQGEVEMEVENNHLIIRSPVGHRENWESFFQSMAENNDDRLLIDESVELSSWDESEWEW